MKFQFFGNNEICSKRIAALCNFSHNNVLDSFQVEKQKGPHTYNRTGLFGGGGELLDKKHLASRCVSGRRDVVKIDAGCMRTAVEHDVMGSGCKVFIN